MIGELRSRGVAARHRLKEGSVALEKRGFGEETIQRAGTLDRREPARDSIGQQLAPCCRTSGRLGEFDQSTLTRCSSVRALCLDLARRGSGWSSTLLPAVHGSPRLCPQQINPRQRGSGALHESSLIATNELRRTSVLSAPPPGRGRGGAALCYHPGARTCRPSLEACSRVRKCAIFFVDGSLSRTDANDNPRTLAQSHLQDTCNRTLLYPTPFWTSAVNNTFLKHRNAATLSAASKIARGGRCRAEIRLRDRSSCRSVALDDRIVSESRPIPSVNATQEGGHCWVPAVLACNAGSPRTPQRFS